MADLEGTELKKPTSAGSGKLLSAEKASPYVWARVVDQADHGPPHEIMVYADTYDDLQRRYMELIMAVESVFQGETRHETARRYIREREQRCCDPACDKADDGTSTPA